jgi:hypothetical protein
MGADAVTRAPNPATVGAMRAAAALALACAACGPSAYACAQDDQCAIDALRGVCQADGLCSFPDDECRSGQRYGEHGGAVGGQCVPVADDDTSSSGVGTTADTLASLDGSSSAPGRETSTDGATDTTTTTDATATTSTGDPVDLDPLLWFAFDEAGVGGVPNLGSLGGIAACTDITCPSSTEGVIGTGAQFDGVDDCAIFPAVPELRQLHAMTIAAWVQRAPIDYDYDCILCKPVGVDPWNSWRLATYDDADGAPVGDFRVGTADDMGVSLASPIPIASWAHVVGTWDGATMVLWIDGAVAQESPNTHYEVDDQPVYLGCDDDHARIGITNFLTGSIDDVRLYGRVLADDEIAALFAAGM